MARRPVHRHTILVDPSFFIPEGAEGVEFDDSILFDEVSFDEEALDDDDVDEPGLEYPKDVKVLSQKLIRGPGGQQAVEVVFEFKSVTGADSYEIKTAMDEAF